ncbi:MAG: hypothetical protein WC785_10070 [Tatlockia sp.]|jgi:hypothetical protein
MIIKKNIRDMETMNLLLEQEGRAKMRGAIHSAIDEGNAIKKEYPYTEYTEIQNRNNKESYLLDKEFQKETKTFKVSSEHPSTKIAYLNRAMEKGSTQSIKSLLEIDPYLPIDTDKLDDFLKDKGLSVDLKAIQVAPEEKDLFESIKREMLKAAVGLTKKESSFKANCDRHIEEFENKGAKSSTFSSFIQSITAAIKSFVSCLINKKESPKVEMDNLSIKGKVAEYKGLLADHKEPVKVEKENKNKLSGPG